MKKNQKMFHRFVMILIVATLISTVFAARCIGKTNGYESDGSQVECVDNRATYQL